VEVLVAQSGLQMIFSLKATADKEEMMML